MFCISQYFLTFSEIITTLITLNQGEIICHKATKTPSIFFVPLCLSGKNSKKHNLIDVMV